MEENELLNALTDRLLKKSQEALLLALEIYNKPTIQYRVEGFAFFICNAWELMLKAHLIKTKGNEAIYYKNKPDRTISLSDCVKIIFTNDKDPLRINLEKIIELRDTSTHFITEEYEMVYVPLFQSCLLNFCDKIKQFHNIDISDIMPANFLTLSVNFKVLDENNIIAKYPEELANKILTYKNNIEDLSINNNEKFSIRVEHKFFITKDKNEATAFVKIDNSGEQSVQILKELKDPNNTHKYTAKSCIETIKNMLSREGIELEYNNKVAKFNHFHFTNFVKYFGLKNNEAFCYIHKQFSSPQYSYSQQAINFIFDELKKDPKDILNNIKK